MSIVLRPKADKKKIHCKDEFELCYIRHQYFRRTIINPSEEEMAPYIAIVENIAKNNFYTYRNIFALVGFEYEDIVNIGKIHIVSYLGLFSMERMPEKYEEFVNVFAEKNESQPSEEDFLNKNKANFTEFLKQRMQDLVRVCKQKGRNIKGLPTEEFFAFSGKSKPPKVLRNLVKNYEKYGYKKIDAAVFKSIRKKAKAQEERVFKFNDLWYVCVPVDQKLLGLEDFSGAGLDPYDNIHNMSPERLFFSQEEENFWEEKQKEFKNYPVRKRIRMVKTFIENNKGNVDLKEEIKAARNLLKHLGA